VTAERIKKKKKTTNEHKNRKMIHIRAMIAIKCNLPSLISYEYFNKVNK